MKTSLISIIIPVYNAEKYLCRCLNSIINQTYQNLEIILVDDGSIDGSGEICDSFAVRDSRIKVIHIPNGGASLARKKGLDLSKGKYVTFVDSDDWVSPYYVSTLFHMIDEYEVNISACGVKRVKPEDNKDEDLGSVNTQLLSFEKLMPRFFKYEFWGFWGKIYIKSCLDNLNFPKATLSEDYYVMTQLFNRERQMAITDAPLYYYEYHDNSLSHQKLSMRAFEEFENVKAVYDYVCLNMPQYKDYAFSNVIETIVKLNFLKKQDKEDYFKEQFSAINYFLKKTRIRILYNMILPKNVKLLALGMSFYPSLSVSLYSFINGKV